MLGSKILVSSSYGVSHVTCHCEESGVEGEESNSLFPHLNLEDGGRLKLTLAGWNCHNSSDALLSVFFSYPVKCRSMSFFFYELSAG